MNHLIVQKVIQSWKKPPDVTRGWLELAALLEEAHGHAGLALWAHDALCRVDLGEKERLLAALHIGAVFLAQAQGHTLLDADSPLMRDVLRRVQEAASDSFFAPENARSALARCIEGPLGVLFAPDGAKAPFVCEGTVLQLARTRFAEDACIRLLRARMQVLPRPAEGDVLEGYSGMLDEHQREMIRRAAVRRIFWVSGGPGTGKTTCIHGLLHALGRLRIAAERVAIAAPTGKAAFRVTASLRRMAKSGTGPFDDAICSGSLEALTLHRLLEYRPETDSFGRHEGNPLDLDAVIVDESSMVDMPLLHALLRALPVDAALIFVGDPDQLPAVGQGAPFQIAWEQGFSCRPEFFFRLERNYRAQQALFSDMERLMKQDETLQWISPTLHSRSEGISLCNINNDSDFMDFVEYIFQENYNESYWDLALERHVMPDAEAPVQDPAMAHLVQLVERAQACPVLCAVHEGLRGTRRVNGFMQRRHPVGGADLQPGEPVMVQINDYARGLFNGDFGVVADLESKGRPVRCAVFKAGDRLRAFELTNLQVERAWAFSVHKSQGSEYDRVVFVMPDAPSGILTRELVYTALTRARRFVRVAGDPASMFRALRTVVRRRSRLAKAWCG